MTPGSSDRVGLAHNSRLKQYFRGRLNTKLSGANWTLSTYADAVGVPALRLSLGPCRFNSPRTAVGCLTRQLSVWPTAPSLCIHITTSALYAEPALKSLSCQQTRRVGETLLFVPPNNLHNGVTAALSEQEDTHGSVFQELPPDIWISWEKNLYFFLWISFYYDFPALTQRPGGSFTSPADKLIQM